MSEYNSGIRLNPFEARKALKGRVEALLSGELNSPMTKWYDENARNVQNTDFFPDEDKAACEINRTYALYYLEHCVTTRGMAGPDQITAAAEDIALTGAELTFHDLNPEVPLSRPGEGFTADFAKHVHRYGLQDKPEGPPNLLPEPEVKLASVLKQVCGEALAA